MTDLDEFLNGLYAERDEGRAERAGDRIVSDEGLAEAGLAMRPIYERQCERVGVEFAPLWDQGEQVVVPTVPIVIARCVNQPVVAVTREVLGYGTNMWIDGFLAGGLWEQERALGL